MALVIAGIDEAGYGPLLGPLCVGLAVFRVPEAEAGRAPDLWELLGAAVTRTPGRGGATDRLGRVAIADSKKLKLANSAKSVDPVINLERGVLAMLRQLAPSGELPADDDAMFEQLGAALAGHACYAGPSRALPLAITAGEASLAAAFVGRALAAANVELLDLRCRVTPEAEFNRTVRASGNKADTTIDAIASHLGRVWERFGDGTHGKLGIVCDRLGGRADYAPVLARALPGAAIETLEESPTRSRYVVTDGPRRAGVAFLTEGEDAHLPVALASMTAKLVRELAMRRFNAYWSGRARVQAGVELKPTAGYSQDGRRWLHDARALLAPQDRLDLVRIA